MSIHTKWRLANALISIMNTTPFHKITVKDICIRCNEKRQTFYYHFKDKYDLVTWIYYEDATKIISENSDESWEIVLEKIFQKLLSRKSFYKNALEENGQNALIDYFVEHDILIYKNKLKLSLKTEHFDDNLKFAIEYHAYACAHMTKKLLSTYWQISPAEIAHLMYSNMPPALKAATSPQKNG